MGVYDHATGAVTKRVRAAFGHPVNDSHCTPALVIDSTGILHLIAGAHGRPFRYTHSQRPLDISTWTPETIVLDSGYWDSTTDHNGIGKQTYASLVCDSDDTLHLVFRQTRRFRTGRFPQKGYHGLCYQTRPAGGEWSKPLMLAYPAAGDTYANFYQKLTRDRDGRLYLSFNIYRGSDVPTIYRQLRRFRYRMVWWSEDGKSWQFATFGDDAMPSVATPSASPAAIASPPPSATPKASASPTPSASATPTISPSPSASATISPSPMPSPSPAATGTLEP